MNSTEGLRKTVMPDRAVVAPVVPTSDAAVRLRPIGLLRNKIQDGMWAPAGWSTTG